MAVAIERVVSAKGNDMSARQQMGEATFHHPPRIEGVRVEKGGQGKAKHVGAVQLLRKGLDHKFVRRRIGASAAIGSATAATRALQDLGDQVARPCRRIDHAVGDQIHVLLDIDQSRD